MTKKVYHLKGSTHREQYRHMNAVLDFREELKVNQAETLTPLTRQWMIEQIKLRIDNFEGWYNEVYKLRADGKSAEYEAAITEKFMETEAEQTDPRVSRRESILAAFAEEPLSKPEAIELYTELAEIDASLQIHPSDTCNAFISASLNQMEEIEY